MINTIIQQCSARVPWAFHGFFSSSVTVSGDAAVSAAPCCHLLMLTAVAGQPHIVSKLIASCRINVYGVPHGSTPQCLWGVTWEHTAMSMACHMEAHRNALRCKRPPEVGLSELTRPVPGRMSCSLKRPACSWVTFKHVRSLHGLPGSRLQAVARRLWSLRLTCLHNARRSPAGLPC